MDGWLKQSTAVTVKIGPFLDDTDGKTAETALTLEQADVRVAKNGGDIAQKDNANACPHDEKGLYDCGLSTTDTGTLGLLRLDVQETGALPVWHTYMVAPANVWDSLFGSDKLQVHADEITAGLITATSIASDAIAAAKIANNAITADKIASNAITDAKINTGAITAAKFAADAITSTVIADNAIAAAKIAASALDGKGDWSTFDATSSGVTLADVAHGGASATLTLSDYTDFHATGFSTHAAADVWSVAVRALTDKADFTLADDAITASKIAADAIAAAKIAANALDGKGDWSTFDATASGVTLADVTHGGASAVLTLSNYSDFKATGFMLDTEDGSSFTAIPWNAAWDTEVESECYDALNTAFTDASGLNANSLMDRIRTLGWILRNKVEVTNANGNTVIYKDDNSTTAFSVNTMLTDDSTTTTRLRAA